MNLPTRRSSRAFARDNALELTALIDRLEPRRLFSANYPQIPSDPVEIGTARVHNITFQATNGLKTTIAVAYATAEITFAGSNIAEVYQGHGFFPDGETEIVESVTIANAVPGKAALSIQCQYGPGLFPVTSITGGDLSSLYAPEVNLVGSLSLMSVKHLTIAEVTGASINVQGTAGSVKILGNMSGTLTAGSVTNLSAEELNQETITATDTYSASHLDIGTIDATAGIDQSTITSAGNIGTIKSLFVQNSLISAATADPSPSGTAGSDDFTAPAIIQSVDIQKTGNFANSTITAHKVGSLNLSQISGGGGIAAEEFGSVGGISPAGELDRVTFILHSGALRSPAKLQAALHQLNIACTTVTGEPDITVFYDLDLTILT